MTYGTRPARTVKAGLVYFVALVRDYVVLPALQEPQLPRTVELAGVLSGSYYEYSIPLNAAR